MLAGQRRQQAQSNGLAALDNPDQRIAEDINTFTQRSLFFLLILIGATMQLTAFSRVLWGISHTLVYFLVIYAVSGTVITLRVYGRPLTGLNFRQLKREFRIFGIPWRFSNSEWHFNP